MTPEEYDTGAIAFEPSAIPVHILWEHYAVLVKMCVLQDVHALSPRTIAILGRSNLQHLASRIGEDVGEMQRFVDRGLVGLPPAGRDSATEGPASQTP